MELERARIYYERVHFQYRFKTLRGLWTTERPGDDVYPDDRHEGRHRPRRSIRRFHYGGDFDFQYVDDVAKAFIMAAGRKYEGELTALISPEIP